MWGGVTRVFCCSSCMYIPRNQCRVFYTASRNSCNLCTDPVIIKYSVLQIIFCTFTCIKLNSLIHKSVSTHHRFLTVHGSSASILCLLTLVPCSTVSIYVILLPRTVDLCLTVSFCHLHLILYKYFTVLFNPLHQCSLLFSYRLHRNFCQPFILQKKVSSTSSFPNITN